jgi:hypothetical protein
MQPRKFHHLFGEAKNEVVSLNILNILLSILFVLLSLSVIFFSVFLPHVFCSEQKYASGCQEMKSIDDCSNLASITCRTRTGVYLGSSCDYDGKNAGFYRFTPNIIDKQICQLWYKETSLISLFRNNSQTIYPCPINRCCGVMESLTICPNIIIKIGIVCSYITFLFLIFQVLYSRIVWLNHSEQRQIPIELQQVGDNAC